MSLTGVRVGPLDPDATAEFGNVAAKTSARQLVRYHVALNPPALIGALSRSRNDARSEALDMDELRDAVQSAWDEHSDPTPENFVLTGAAVRGAEDAEKVVTFTWKVPVEEGGSGRTGKGFIPYDEDTVPNSVAWGDEAAQIEKLKAAGLPWQPSGRALAAAGITGTGIAETAPENLTELADVEAERDAARQEADKAAKERDELAGKLADLETRLREVEAAGGTGDETPPAETPAGTESEEPQEPWEGYIDSDANAVKKYLKDMEDGPDKVAAADRVLAFEARNAKRSSVIASANAIVDRQPAS